MALSRVSEEGVVEAIISNCPMTLDEDRERKRQTLNEKRWIATLIPGLPDDIVRRILANIPRSEWPKLRRVSKAWQKTLEDPFFYQSRLDLGITEEWCYTEAWNPVTKLVSWFAYDSTNRRWLALPPIPRKRGLDPEIFGRSAAAARGELYVVGGKAGESGPTLREMLIYSPFSHRWRRGKSMLTTRHTPLIFPIFDRKIYVIGGFDFLDNNIQTAECYDVDTEEWTYVGNEGSPQLICPPRYCKGWQVQWTSFSFNGDEHFVTYKTKESTQLVKYYVPKKGSWELTIHRDKSKALMRYGLGCNVSGHIVMLDWANGRMRYTWYPDRTVGWRDVRGLVDLDWVSILTSNPKVTGLGTKFVLVGRRLSMLMIETHPLLLQEQDHCFIDFVAPEPEAPELEPISCLVLAA